MIKKLNEWIAETFPHLGKIEFVKGEGYFYFVADDWRLDIYSIGVFALNQATLEQWKEWIADEINSAVERATDFRVDVLVRR
tara:strand:- start:5212 stop:5457 length:246 start_codon:yes stop_codon:yes gene_type:complete